jgi:transcriptional regulator with XRE-family HTH domain
MPGTCRSCGNATTSARYAHCLACWTASCGTKPRCGCGGKKAARAQMCWRCRFGMDLGASTRCPECGGPKSPHGKAKRCRACWLATIRPQRVPGYYYEFPAERFRALCEEIGWSFQALADESGVHCNTLSRWARGVRNPTRGEWARVAAVLGLVPCGHCVGGFIDPGIEPALLTIDAIEQQRGQYKRYRQRKRQRSA